MISYNVNHTKRIMIIRKKVSMKVHKWVHTKHTCHWGVNRSYEKNTNSNQNSHIFCQNVIIVQIAKRLICHTVCLFMYYLVIVFKFQYSFNPILSKKVIFTLVKVNSSALHCGIQHSVQCTLFYI